MMNKWVLAYRVDYEDGTRSFQTIFRGAELECRALQQEGGTLKLFPPINLDGKPVVEVSVVVCRDVVN